MIPSLKMVRSPVLHVSRPKRGQCIPGPRQLTRRHTRECVWILVSLAALVLACTTPNQNAQVIQPNPGETLASVPGPMPDFGPFDSIGEASFAACPVIMKQPHALIPVSKSDQNFRVYWRTASEYCAWLYSIDQKHVDMSLLVTSPVQDDPSRRRCDLPANVVDGRQPEAAIAYLVMLHNHPLDDKLSLADLQAIADMARIHGATAEFQGRRVSISIVAFFGQERDGTPTCAGFYHYVPAQGDNIIAYRVRDGRLTSHAVARVSWSGTGTPKIIPIEEQP